MAEIKTPSQISDDYLAELKSLKPEVNTSQKDTDWWIKSRSLGGVVGGVYADQRLIANDAFPQRARTDAIQKFLEEYFGAEGTGDFLPATQANGFIGVTGQPSQTVAQGLQAIYVPNGNVYYSIETITLDPIAGTGLLPAKSVAFGQSQNLNNNAPLNIPSPPTGLLVDAIAASGGFRDARDIESATEARSRILTRIRSPLSVGRESDYEQFARAADPSVTGASVQRFPFGLGTVAVYITSGTTDIDAAIDQDETISKIPSDALIDIVQAYLEINSPITDCVTVLKPVAVPQDVTVEVKFVQGDLDTILSGQNLSQRDLVTREVRRALYKTPVGGRKLGASGYVLASEIEETIDVALSAESVIAGTVPILLDRQVEKLTTSGFNRAMLPNETIIEGTITIVAI